jgi:hypothetical protein
MVRLTTFPRNFGHVSTFCGVSGTGMATGGSFCCNLGLKSFKYNFFIKIYIFYVFFSKSSH